METQTPHTNINNVIPENQTLPETKLKNNKPLIIAGSIGAILLLTSAAALGTYVVSQQDKKNNKTKSADSLMSTVTPTTSSTPAQSVTKEYIDVDTKLSFNYSDVETVTRVKEEAELRITIQNAQTSEKLVITQILGGIGGLLTPLKEPAPRIIMNDGKTEVVKVFNADTKTMGYYEYSATGIDEKSDYGFIKFFPSKGYVISVVLQDAKDNKSSTFDALVKTIYTSKSVATPTPVVKATSALKTYNNNIIKPNFSFTYNTEQEFVYSESSDKSIITVGPKVIVNSQGVKGFDPEIVVLLIDADKNMPLDNQFSTKEEYYARNYSGIQSAVIDTFSKEIIANKSYYYGEASGPNIGADSGVPRYTISAYGVKMTEKYFLVITSRSSETPISQTKESMKQIATSFTLK